MAQATRTFRIFVSSTFSDLKAERNALQERVFPRLRELCAAHGTRFQAIDLRWGVSEEASLDQQTMKICLGEIARCQKVTPRPNFIVLLGDRYGWRPLPEEIPAQEFEEIERRVLDVADKTLLTVWYRRDDNAVRPVHCLQPRTREFEDYAVWEEQAERPLRSILLQATAGMKLTAEQRLKYVASATEQEIVRGALRVEDAPEHVFCFFRRIKGLPQDRKAKDFLDLDEEGNPDSEARQQLERLKGELRGLLPANVHEYEAAWTGNAVTADHIDQLCKDVYESLSLVILEEVGAFILEELGPPEKVDPLEVEITEHQVFGEDRAKFFVGREEILETIGKYVKSEDPHPLAVWGESGSGKSALVAKAVQEALEMHPDAEVVFRFIGATPESSSGRELLESLCRQISRRYGQDESIIPMDYRELVAEFPEGLGLATAEKPLILLLDALDQLSDADNARNLVWLPAELPEHVRLVVSTLPGECLSVLQGKVPPGNLVELEPMPLEEGRRLLELWLEEAGRTLQEHQREEVLGKFERCGLPLYLKLAFEEARRWKSYTEPKETTLGPDVPGVIRDLLARLSSEGDHGEMMVSRSLGYLDAAKNGLGEDEVLDVLSADEEVMEDFLRSSPRSPKVDRLPVVVWSRLYFDLEPYLTERSADETSLMTFYHRQLGEVVVEDYLAGKEKQDRHGALARYFGAQPLYIEKDEQKFPNIRKLSELPCQQARGGLGDDLQGTLTRFDFLEAKVSGQGVQTLIEDYDLVALPAVELSGDGRKSLRLIKETLQLSAHALVGDSTQLWNQLYGRLMTFKRSLIQAMLAEPPEAHSPRLRLTVPSLTPAGGLLLRTLSGHSHGVTAAAITPDGKTAVSASYRTLKVWDLETGEESLTLSGHSDWVTAVAITPDGKTAVSGSDDRTLKVWDLETGEERLTLSGHSKEVNAVAITLDGKTAVSGSDDRTLKAWDLETGEERLTLSGHSKEVNAVAITLDGKTAVSASRDDPLKVWDLETGEERLTLCEHAGWVTAVAITPDGKTAVSASGDPEWSESCGHETWNLETGEQRMARYGELRNFPGDENWITSVAIASDNRTAVSASLDHTLKVWDLETGEERLTLRGHSDTVEGVAITSDGKTVVSASNDRTLKVWDIETGKECPTLCGHSDWVEAVAIASDNKTAVSASFDHTLKVWDITTGKLRFTLSGHSDWVTAVAITSDGKTAVSGSNDNTLKVWDLERGEGLHTLTGHDLGVNAVAVTSDDRRAISASNDETLKVWDLETGEERLTLSGHSAEVYAVAITLDGKTAVSASRDDPLKVWDLETGEERLTLCEHAGWVTAVAITPDGKTAVSASLDHTLKVWDLQTGEDRFTLCGHSDGVYAVAITPDGKTAVSASCDRTLKVWDLETGDELFTMSGHSKEVTAVVITPDGKTAVSASDDHRLKVWDLKTGEERFTLLGHSDEVGAVAVTPDGKTAVSASYQTLQVWDLETGGGGGLLAEHSEPVRDVAITPDGKTAISASADRTLKVWDLETGNQRFTLSGHSSWVRRVAITPDGKTAISGADRTLRVWDLETGEERLTLSGHSDSLVSRNEVTDVAITPDGKTAVSGSDYDRTLKVWDLETGEERFTLYDHFTSCVAPDGNSAVSASLDHGFKVWDLETGEERFSLSGHWKRRIAFAITPDSNTAVCALDDHTLRVWDLETGEERLTLSGHSSEVRGIAITPDGKTVVSASDDGTLKMWNLETGEERSTLSGFSDTIYGVAITPNGKVVVFALDHYILRVWDIAIGEHIATFVGDSEMDCCAITPNGRTIAVGDALGRVHILRLEGAVAQETSARQDAAIAEEKAPAGADGSRERGARLFKSGEFEEALECFNQALMLEPEDWKLLQYRAAALIRLDRDQEALETLDHILDRQLVSGQNLGYMFTGKANALVGLKRYEEALTYYQKALEIVVGHSDTWFMQGYAFYQLGQFEEALASFIKGRNLKDEARTSLHIGNCLLALERYSEAEEEFAALISQGSRDPQAFYGLGVAKYALGDMRGARTYLERFIDTAGPEHKHLLSDARKILERL